MKFHMLMLMNEWMMLVLMKCKCQMQCLTLGCYSYSVFIRSPLLEYPPQGQTTNLQTSKSIA